MRSPVPATSTGELSILLAEMLPIVALIVEEYVKRVPRHIRRDELISAGLLGLVQAFNTYEPDRGVKFSSYARLRIRGSLLDELRHRDWAPRGVRTKLRSLDSAVEALNSRFSRRPSADEVAEYMGLDVNQVRDLRRHRECAQLLSTDAPLPGNAGEDEMAALDGNVPTEFREPLRVLEQRELQAYLRDAVENLPHRHRCVVSGLFFENLSIPEIAESLGVTNSRVSQIRHEAVSLMRQALTSALNESDIPVVSVVGAAARRRASYCLAVAAASTFTGRIEGSSDLCFGIPS